MTSVRNAFFLLLAVALIGTAHAQQSHVAGSAHSAAAEPSGQNSPDRVVLKVGTAQVTQQEFEAGIKDLEPQGDPDRAGDSDKARRGLGDDYASVLMLSQRALAEHLDSTPELSRQLALQRMQTLSDAEFAKLMEEARPTQAEISQYYTAHAADYDQVQVRRLFIWKKGSNNTRGLSAEDARSRADEVLHAAAAGGDPKSLADKFKNSQDGMVDDLPMTFSRGELPPPMEKVAFALKDGAWAEVENTPDSLILLQLVKQDHRSVQGVSSLIEQRLQAEKMQAKLAELKKNAGIWMDEKYFGTAVAPVPGEQRPGLNPPSKNRKSAAKEETSNEDVR